MAKLGVLAVTFVLLCTAGARARAQEADDLGHLEFALHGRMSDADDLAERAAWVTLNVPFDRLARPRLLSTATTPTPPKIELPIAEAQNAAGTTPTPSATASLLTFAQLQIFADFSGRATRAALALAGTAAERRRLDGLASRSRASALLPELRLRAVRNTDQALRLTPVTDDPYRVTQADGAGTVLEASVTFRLDRLVFASAELVVERLRQQAGEERLELERRVTTTLLALLRARSLACLDGVSEEAHALQVITLLQLFTELDLLTGGWFREQAAALSRAVWGFSEAVLGVCQAPASTKPVASLDDSE
jgi:hypothetical protein